MSRLHPDFPLMTFEDFRDGWGRLHPGDQIVRCECAYSYCRGWQVTRSPMLWHAKPDFIGPLRAEVPFEREDY